MPSPEKRSHDRAYNSTPRRPAQRRLGTETSRPDPVSRYAALRALTPPASCNVCSKDRVARRPLRRFSGECRAEGRLPDDCADCVSSPDRPSLLSPKKPGWCLSTSLFLPYVTCDGSSIITRSQHAFALPRMLMCGPSPTDYFSHHNARKRQRKHP